VLFQSAQYIELDHISARVTFGGDTGSDERLILFTTFCIDVQALSLTHTSWPWQQDASVLAFLGII